MQAATNPLYNAAFTASTAVQKVVYAPERSNRSKNLLQPKAIGFLTDAKLVHAASKRIEPPGAQTRAPMRQSYQRVAKHARHDGGALRPRQVIQSLPSTIAAAAHPARRLIRAAR
jgi:hypothetical protein